ncbi:unnamed protein product [Ixodes persulcatus]
MWQKTSSDQDGKQVPWARVSFSFTVRPHKGQGTRSSACPGSGRLWSPQGFLDTESRGLSAVLGGPGGHRGPDRSCCRWGRRAASTPWDPILSGATTTIPATPLMSTSGPGHRRWRRPLHSRRR